MHSATASRYSERVTPWLFAFYLKKYFLRHFDSDLLRALFGQFLLHSSVNFDAGTKAIGIVSVADHRSRAPAPLRTGRGIWRKRSSSGPFTRPHGHHLVHQTNRRIYADARRFVIRASNVYARVPVEIESELQLHRRGRTSKDGARETSDHHACGGDSCHDHGATSYVRHRARLCRHHSSFVRHGFRAYHSSLAGYSLFVPHSGRGYHMSLGFPSLARWVGR